MLKVGDYVVVKEDLEIGKWYEDDVCVVESMEQYFGKATRVKEVFFDETYYLDIDNGDWFWTENMLIKLVPQTEEKHDELERRVEKLEEIIKNLK